STVLCQVQPAHNFPLRPAVTRYASVVSPTPFGRSRSASVTPVAAVVSGSYGESAGTVRPEAAANGWPAVCHPVEFALLRDIITSPNALTLPSKKLFEVTLATKESTSCACSSIW